MQLWRRPFRFPSMKRILIFLSLVLPSLAAFAQDSSSKYIELADSADNYIRRERWEQAERVILEALRLEPGNFTNALLLSNLGVVQTNLGKPQEALESYRLGISIAPSVAALYTNRARTLMTIGNYKDALVDLDKTLEIDSVQKWPLKMRGLLKLSGGDLDGAKSDFMHLQKIDPKNPAVFQGLGRVAQMEGKDDEALAYYDEALAIEDDAETLFSRILLKINMLKYSEASEDIRLGIKSFPENPDFYLARGYLHRLHYRNDEAEIDKKIALDKGADPQFVEQLIPKIGK